MDRYVNGNERARKNESCHLENSVVSLGVITAECIPSEVEIKQFVYGPWTKLSKTWLCIAVKNERDSTTCTIDRTQLSTQRRFHSSPSPPRERIRFDGLSVEVRKMERMGKGWEKWKKKGKRIQPRRTCLRTNKSGDRAVVSVGDKSDRPP